MKKLLWIAGIGVIAIAAVALYFWLVGTSRITCQITNASGDKVTGVAVIVGGNRFAMGTLQPGESRRVTLSPIQVEGGVELVFHNTQGTLTSHCIYGYVEHKHWRGTVHVEIGHGGTVRTVSNTIRISLY